MKKNICKCGNEKDYRAKQCKDCYSLSMRGSGNPNFKHGHALTMRKSKTFMIWASMLSRCNNEKHKQYYYYGGRGIKVCKKWFSFENFLKDMGEKPSGLELDRINNNKGYSKSNCRWTTSQNNNLNRRKIFKNKTSKHKGVYWHKRDKKWCVSITFNKTRFYGGSFVSEKEAHKSYLKLKKEIYNGIGN